MPSGAVWGVCGGMVKMIPGALSDPEKNNNNHGVGVSLASHGELCTVCPRYPENELV